MKRIFVSLLCMTVMIYSSHAQIVGDMNNDGKLSIEDITVLTSTLLGNTAQRTISDDGTDQTKLIGSWAARDGSTINIQSGGKATMSKSSAVTNYEYFPSKGCLAFYNSDNSLVTACQVAAFTSSCLLLGANGTANQYYPTDSYATNVQMSKKSLNLFLNKTYSLMLIPIPTTANIYNVTWSSNNTSVATVSESGVVTAKAVGTATITARTVDGKTSTCAVTVTKPVESLVLAQKKMTLPYNTTFTIDAIVSPSDATNKNLTWSSLFTNLATVSNGTVTTGSTTGRTLIIAKTTDGTNLSDTCEVRVQNVTPTGLTLSKTTASLAPYGTLTLTATITPTSSLTVIWSSSNENIATVDQTGKVTAKQRGGTAKIIATIAGTSITKSCTVTVDDSNMYVDLGLPSGTLWATMNVGANSPEDYGNYYAWGETKAYGEEDTSNPYNYNYNSNSSYTKTYYDWITYKWSGHTMFTLKKYINSAYYGTVDNVSTLELADDAAYVNLGPDWRTPTKAEWKELIESCTWKWTTMNKINGYMVTSKKDTSKSIFLPAAGYRGSSTLHEAGSNGDYWSRSLHEEASHSAWRVVLLSSSVDENGGSRCSARSVRPVRNK